MFNETYDEKITNILFFLYSTLFTLLLFIFSPIAHSFCDNANIPYDLTLTVTSMGFGNELVLLLSLFTTVIIYFIFNKITRFVINAI